MTGLQIAGCDAVKIFSDPVRPTSPYDVRQTSHSQNDRVQQNLAFIHGEKTRPLLKSTRKPRVHHGSKPAPLPENGTGKPQAHEEILS